MAIDWKKHFDALVKDVEWDKAEVKEKIYDAAVAWIGGDRKVLFDAIRKAIADEEITSQEVIGILAIVAQYSVKGSKAFPQEFVDRLLASLEDNKLTPTEIAETAVNWLAVRKKLAPNVLDLLRAAVADRLNKDDVRDAILQWIEDKASKSLRDEIEAILKGKEPVNLRGLILLSAAFLIQEGKLTNAGSTDEDFIGDFKGALKKLGQSKLADALRSLAAKDYPTLARLVLVAIGVKDENGIAEPLARMLLGEKPDDIVREFMVKAIKRGIPGASDSQAASLTRAIIGLIKGDLKLIPEQTEKELYFKEYHIAPEEYPVWVEVRKILYTAKLALVGGPVVDTDPLAKPHVFATAVIAPDTEVGSLIEKSRWPDLVTYIQNFTWSAYRSSPRAGKYRTDSPIALKSVQNHGTAQAVFDDIMFNIYV
jgi:hypothetical protein